MEPIVVATLYKFVTLSDYHALREPLLDACITAGVLGTLLLAREGINGTIAGSQEGIDQLLGYLRRDPRLADLEHKESQDHQMPFYRMKVKLKKEIVTMGVVGVDPNQRVGNYVRPADWNDLIDDPEVLLIDTRNDYECDIGSFKGALDPRTRSFRDFPAFVRANLDPSVHKKVAMFCTGGIRCEKASTFMLNEGFAEVYHLQGGILKYLEEVAPQNSLWEGECFVFDNRVAVDHHLRKGRYDQCYGCRHPITQEDKHSGRYEAGVCCPHCYEHLTPDQQLRFRERQKQMELAAQRGELHVGAPPPARQRSEARRNTQVEE